MTAKKRRRLGCCLSLAVLVGCMFIPGCQVPYLLHLAQGQLEMLASTEPVSDVLARDSLDVTVRDRLLLIAEIKTYAADSLGYSPDEAYTDYYDSQGRPASYVLTACARDSFRPYTWWFPIVGTVPYKGFFDEAWRDEEAAALREDFDVYVGTAAAYSTLGWLDDPIMSAWMDDPVGDLAELILHELTHRELYLASNIRFNETLATFFGQTAAEGFLAARYGPDSAELADYLAGNRDALRFTSAVHRLRVRLDTLYAEVSGEEAIARRGEVFAAAQQEVAALPFERYAYRWFVETELNNALVLALDRYYGDLPLFAALYVVCSEDLVAMLAALKTVEDASDAPAAVLDLLHRRLADAPAPAELLRALAACEGLAVRSFVRYLDPAEPEELRAAALFLLREQTGFTLEADAAAWEAALTTPGSEQ